VHRERLSDAMEEILASPKSDESYGSFAGIVRKIVKKEGVKRSLNMMLDFFDGLTVCIDSEICDSDTAKQLFQARAYEIYVNFYTRIMDVRDVSKSDEYAKGLVHIAKDIKESSTAFKRYRKLITY
jgi:hypothetical protein